MPRWIITVSLLVLVGNIAARIRDDAAITIAPSPAPHATARMQDELNAPTPAVAHSNTCIEPKSSTENAQIDIPLKRCTHRRMS